MTIVVLDAMGGDHAPRATVEGAVLAARPGREVVLVGDREILERELARLDSAPADLRIVPAADAIEMGDSAVLGARNRRDSSIYVGLELLRRAEGDVFVSLGNTGAVFALALVVLRRLPGVERPALTALLPTQPRPTLLVDAGANADARVSHLLQFARLGSAYIRAVREVPRPTVGLLNIGEEATKGSSLALAAHKALRDAEDVHFIGNVEGSDVLEGKVDIVVTDGFTGNVALKFAEAMGSMMLNEVATAARRSLRGRLGGLLLRPAVSAVRDRLDYRQYGGVPLLGVNGIVLVGHGRSDARAVASAVSTAAVAAESGMLDALCSSAGGAAPGGAAAASDASSGDDG